MPVYSMILLLSNRISWLMMMTLMMMLSLATVATESHESAIHKRGKWI